MLKVLKDMPENVVGVEASGKVTDDDYKDVLIPAIKDTVNAHSKIRFMYVLGDDFDGWSLGAMWQDAKLGLHERQEWEKIAIVSDLSWMQHTMKALGWMVPGEVRVFSLADVDAARDWASS